MSEETTPAVAFLSTTIELGLSGDIVLVRGKDTAGVIFTVNGDMA